MNYDDVVLVIDEIRLMWHRTLHAIEAIHADTDVSVSMRAVLEYVSDHGPHTVSAMARARGVSRQHIQTLANDLLERGLVERSDNPDHARAPLIAITGRGSAVIDAMRTREREALGPSLAGAEALTSQRLDDAAEVIRAIGTAMASVEVGS